MPERFDEALEDRIVLFDGAMGTEIYARGVFLNRSYDELCLAAPGLVREIHAAYLQAGADVLTTNSFGANRARLSPFGLEARVAEINRAAVTLAREVAGERCWVAGSIGPLGQPLRPVGTLSPGDAFAIFREQAQALAEGGADLLVLETFSALSELWQALRAVRSVCDLPVVTLMTFQRRGDRDEPMENESPSRAARAMAAWSPTALGANCGNGPRDMLDVIEEMARVTDRRLVAMPNAGLPQVVDGRTIYLAGPEYMAEYARRFVQKGASAVGGCCGTNPAVIREMRTFLRSIAPTKRRPVPAPAPPEVPVVEPVPVAERSAFARILASGRFAVSVELDPPRGVDPGTALEGAGLLERAGVDVVNIADGPRAMARMGPAFLARLVQERHGIEAVVHVCCRDRNLLGLQMDLLGYHALGIRNLLVITGDPPKLGSHPHATAVFDLDSIGLIALVQALNRGLDLAGQPIGSRTAFHVGAGCNPSHLDLDLEVERYGRKIEAGAEFFFSQPVFEAEVLARFLDRVARFPAVPFLVGVLPLVSLRNAEFFHNEVPGMRIPDAILDRLRNAGSREAQREVGIETARETLAAVRGDPRIRGVYLFPPFGSYKAVPRILEILGPRS